MKISSTRTSHAHMLIHLIYTMPDTYVTCTHAYTLVRKDVKLDTVTAVNNI